MLRESTHHAHPLAITCLFALMLASAAAVVGDEIDWVGYQNDCMVTHPDVGSFFHGDNWYGYVVPDSGDVAFFGTGFDPQGNGVRPHHIYFGDSCLSVPNCGDMPIEGGHADSDELHIHSDTWTFDFDRLELNCDAPGSTTGDYTVTGLVVIGDALDNGNSGSASLTVLGPGTMSSGEVLLAVTPNTSGALTVSGSEAQWNASANIAVGNDGSGSLEISAGALVSTTFADIGRWAGSDGQVTVSGANSRLECSEYLLVGFQTTGHLAITDGGTVINTWCHIASVDGSDGSAVITGIGSNWQTEFMGVGDGGQGSLTVSGGADVHSTTVHIGGYSTAVGDVTVSGNGSSWETEFLGVGDGGQGSLAVQNGADVQSSSVHIGGWPTGVGSASVSDGGSVWQVTGYLDVGKDGFGSLEILDGGEVSCASTAIAAYAGSTGQCTVAGSNSTLGTSGRVDVGRDGLGTLTIESGGNVTSLDGLIGGWSEGHGSVVVNGGGSMWELLGGLTIAEGGDGTLLIQNGGTVTSGDSGHAGGIAALESSIGSVTVDGPGSTWNANGYFGVGNSGTGTLTITNGGTVTDAWVHLAEWETGNGLVVVDGENGGATWTNTDHLNIGVRGVGELQVVNGGTVTCSWAKLGGSANSSGTVTVSNGSSCMLSEWLVVGDDGQGTLTIADAAVSATWLRAGWNTGSTGTLNLDGPAAQLNLTENLEIAEGGSGTMTISGGAVVNSTSSHIGNAPPGEGFVTVTNSGSSWNLSGTLEVGSGATGDLEILDGGVVDCQSNGFVGTWGVGAGNVLVSGPGSRLFVTNGLTIGQADSGSGVVTLADAGELHAATTIRANGRLDGAGSVVGNVQNEGVLAPGHGGGVLDVTGNVTQTANGQMLATLDDPNGAGAGVLAASGDVTLAGELTIELADGYVPIAGDTFEVITATTVTGQFDSIEQPAGTLLNVIYESNRVLLEVFPAPDTLRIEPNALELRLGFPAALRAIATAGGVDFDVTEPAAWSSDDPAIVSVEAPGRIRGEAVGQTLISATYESLGADATVDVRALPDKLKTEMLSVTPIGDAGNGDSLNYRPAVSRDGRHIAFVSRATDLVDPPTDGEGNVYVRDLVTGQTLRVSVAFDGGDPDDWSDGPSLSWDGRFVCFASFATNLLAPGQDTNNAQDVFVADRDADGNGVFDEPGTLSVTRVSVGLGGVQSPAGGYEGTISADGRHVAFTSFSALASGDTDEYADIYVHDRLTANTAWISYDATGQTANESSYEATMSADGRFLSFHSDATDLGPNDQNAFSDVYYVDRDADENGVFDDPGTRELERTSVAYDGSETDGASNLAHMSEAGDLIAFQSTATNLAFGDYVDEYRDVFAWSRVSGQITRVNRTPSGEFSTGDNVGSLNLCPNGRFVGFRSAAKDMCGPDGATVGGYTFRYDLWTGRTETMSLSPFGDPANGISGWIAFSYDGRVIAFVSDADNLAPWDLNGVGDAFVRYDWAGDHDNDGDVDAADFAAFADCLYGPGNPAAAGCEYFDRDADGDVDFSEFAEIQRDFTGATP